LINYYKSYSSLGDDRFFCVTLSIRVCLQVLALSLKSWTEFFCESALVFFQNG